MMRLAASLASLILVFTLGYSAAAHADQRTESDTRNRRLAQRLTAERESSQAVQGTDLMAAASFVQSPLALLSIRLFPDSFGDTVVIGEVQNISGLTINFPHVDVALYSGSLFLGSEGTYVFGGHPVRSTLTGSFFNNMSPGDVGFFKMYTDVPASFVDSYIFYSDGETFPTTGVYASFSQASPLILSPNGLGGTNVTGAFLNTSLNALTYFTKIALSGYQGGVQNDVTFTYLEGFNVPVCSTFSTSGVPPGQSALLNDFFLRPISTVNRLVMEWEERAIYPATTSISAAGGPGSLAVANNCAWSAVSQAPWISITGGNSGNGDGVVSFSVAPNQTTSQRTGTVQVADLVFTVTQAGAACSYTLGSSGTSIGSAGGPASVGISALAGCSWTAVSQAPWITVSSAGTGNGSATVALNIAQNLTGLQRVGTVLIGGQAFTVTQAAQACTFNVSPTFASYTADGGSGSISISTAQTCAWNSASNASWIRVVGSPQGIGSGTSMYTVDANLLASARSSTLIIGGQIVSIAQAGIGTPSSPQNPRLVSTSGNTVSVAWDPPGTPAGMFEYLVEVSNQPTFAALVSAVRLPVHITGGSGSLPNGAIYIRVTAVGPGGASPPSSTLAFLLPGGGSALPPGKPTLVATQVMSNPITLTWSPGPGGMPERYVLHAGTAANSSDLGVFPMGTATSVTAVAPIGAPVYVRVVAVNALGSVASDEAHFFLAAPAAPSAPTLGPAAISGRDVTMAWSPVAGAISYVVLARITPTGPVVASLPVLGTQLTVPAPPGNYFVTVVALGDSQQSQESNQIIVTVQ
jgi:hypothetical protein